MFVKQHMLHSHTGRRESSLNGKSGWVDAESNEISPEDENHKIVPTFFETREVNTQ